MQEEFPEGKIEKKALEAPFVGPELEHVEETPGKGVNKYEPEKGVINDDALKEIDREDKREKERRKKIKKPTIH